MKVALLSSSAAELSALRRILAETGAEETWVASGADAALERWAREPPDTLLLSADGAWDAAELTRELIGGRGDGDGAGGRPRIILITADLDAQIHRVYAALAAGATDVAATPTRDADPGRLVAKLRQLNGPRPAHNARDPVLAIAASTGGPQALARVLTDLPKGLAAPVLLAQHIEAEFLPGLGSWLAAASGRPVEVAADGDALAPGRVLLLRADLQPIVDSTRVVRYQRLDPANPFHPCIDTLFTSLAQVRGLRGVAALLTGMGSDGAKGLLALRAAGWSTLAQDASSSLVFGMPRAAVALSAAGAVVSLEGMAAAVAAGLASLAGSRR